VDEEEEVEPAVVLEVAAVDLEAVAVAALLLAEAVVVALVEAPVEVLVVAPVVELAVAEEVPKEVQRLLLSPTDTVVYSLDAERKICY
jgi:hypothetical protein